MRVLLVEDDRDQASLLARFLTDRKYRVTTVHTGADALSHNGHLDFILLDINLPDTEGTQICPELKRLHPNAFVLMLTARKEEIDRVIGLELGADDYVTKPYSMREVDARMRAIMRRHESVQAKDAVAETQKCLVLDESRCIARYDNQETSLTAQEFKVLAYLARCPKRIYSRNQLIDAVWGEDLYITDRVVDAMIARIRKKLRKAFGAQFIHTKHGLGYSYEHEL